MTTILKEKEEDQKDGEKLNKIRNGLIYKLYLDRKSPTSKIYTKEEILYLIDMFEEKKEDNKLDITNFTLDEKSFNDISLYELMKIGSYHTHKKSLINSLVKYVKINEDVIDYYLKDICLAYVLVNNKISLDIKKKYYDEISIYILSEDYKKDHNLGIDYETILSYFSYLTDIINNRE